MAADEPRFDFPSIARAAGIIVGGTTLFGFATPAIVTLVFNPASSHTGPAAGSIIFTWAFWGVAWALTVWQGAWMLREVGHDRILDDMLVLAVVAAVLLLIVKIMVSLIYEAERVFTGFDVGGALILLVVAFIGARANRF